MITWLVYVGGILGLIGLGWMARMFWDRQNRQRHRAELQARIADVTQQIQAKQQARFQDLHEKLERLRAERQRLQRRLEETQNAPEMADLANTILGSGGESAAPDGMQHDAGRDQASPDAETTPGSDDSTTTNP